GGHPRPAPGAPRHRAARSCRAARRAPGGPSCYLARRSEEHTSELQSHRDLHSFPTRRSSDLGGILARPLAPPGTVQHDRAAPRDEHLEGRRATLLEDRKSTRLNSSHTEIYTLSLHDALPIWGASSPGPWRPQAPCSTIVPRRATSTWRAVVLPCS